MVFLFHLIMLNLPYPQYMQNLTIVPQGQTYKAYNGTLALKRTSSNTEEFTYYFSGSSYLMLGQGLTIQ